MKRMTEKIKMNPLLAYTPHHIPLCSIFFFILEEFALQKIHKNLVLILIFQNRPPEKNKCLWCNELVIRNCSNMLKCELISPPLTQCVSFMCVFTLLPKVFLFPQLLQGGLGQLFTTKKWELVCPCFIYGLSRHSYNNPVHFRGGGD